MLDDILAKKYNLSPDKLEKIKKGKMPNSDLTDSVALMARRIAFKGRRLSVSDFIEIDENPAVLDYLFKNYPSLYSRYIEMSSHIGDWQNEAPPKEIMEMCEKSGSSDQTLQSLAGWIKDATAGKSVIYAWLALRYSAAFPPIWRATKQRHFRILLIRCVNKGYLKEGVDFFRGDRACHYGCRF